jgi:hypothetical protein
LKINGTAKEGLFRSQPLYPAELRARSVKTFYYTETRCQAATTVPH